MAHFEALLGRAIVRVICVCHQTELPYPALLHHIDEKTTGSTTFSGPIGKQIGGDVHSLEVVISPSIPSADLPRLTAEVEQELSSEVKLLYRCA